jgi:CDGSH-type Zn-finger protein
MARVIVKTAHGPFELKVGDKTVKICMCGLSKNQPFCDGSHMKTLDEKDDELYQYDENGKRMEDEHGTEGGCCGGGCCKDKEESKP